MHKTRHLQVAKTGRANITSAHQQCNATTETHTSPQCMVNPAAALRCKHTFYVSLEAAQQAQNMQIPEALLRAPRDIRKLDFLDIHPRCAQSEHTSRSIWILTISLRVRSEILYETQ